MKTNRIIIILGVLLSCINLYASVYEYNGFSFDLDVSSKTATLIKKTSGSYSGNIIIPETFEGPKGIEYIVTAIGDNAFYQCTSVVSVQIPNTVTTIGAKAFYGCNKLTTIQLPITTEELGESAFNGCLTLQSITLPTNITIIRKNLFQGCSNLSSVTFGQNTSAIEDDAFNGCSKLVSLSLPSQVQTIGSRTFYGCSALETLTLPEGVTSVGDYSFQNCSSMSNLHLSKNLQTIGEYAFCNTASLTTLVIPSSVKTIGSEAFNNSGIRSLAYEEGCETALRTYATNLTSVTLPSTLKTIPDKTFYSCRYLANITFPENLIFIGESAFENCYSLAAITIPKEVKTIGINAFRNAGVAYLAYEDGCSIALRTYASNVTSLSIPASITQFANNAFSDFNILENILIDDIEIWNYIFSNLTSNPFPVSHKLYLRGNLLTALNADFGCDISNYAFYGCKGLKQVNITGSITGIKSYAFTQCTDLEAVNISNNVGYIEKEAFQGCSKLSSVRIGNGVKTIGKNAFYGCSQLNSVLIGENVTNIDEGAFKGCNSISSLELPNTLTTIGIDAFSGCSSLQCVTIPAGVSIIAEKTFYDCKNLTEAILPDAITSIGAYSFYGCKRLRTIHMPDAITSFGERCFSDCDSLRYIYLGSNVSQVENYAFAANKSLTGFYIESTTPPSSSSNVFADSDPQYSSLYVPDESINSYSNKSPWNSFGTVSGISSAPIFVTSITLSSPVVIVEEGEPFNLTASISPANATNKKINWTCGNTSVAYVNSNGVGLANTEGITTITASAADKNGASAKCVVIVTNSFKPIESISLSVDSMELAEGKEFLLSAEYLPNAVTFNELSWSSSNPQVALVNSIGLVKALKAGTTTISCTASDGRGANAVCKLTVTEAVDPTIGDANEDGGVSVSDLAYVVHVIMEELAQGADISLYDINGDGEITNEDVKGIADLILGRNTSSVVRLLKLSNNDITIGVRESFQLKCTTIPYKYAQQVEWSSGNSEVATVDAEGNVTALKAGKAIITATAPDGSGLADECCVTVDGSYGNTDGHTWVDLGLPSGTHWATQNLGALSAAEYGEHYAWGEIAVKDIYDWSTYKYCNGSATTLTKYCNAASKGIRDNLTVLQPADDAVTAEWGDNWCIPTKEQFDELFNPEYTITTWTQQNGLWGRLIASKLNGKSLFLPAAGYVKNNSLTSSGSGGYYATRNLYETDADYNVSLNFGSSNANGNNYTFRCYGQSIRPVFSSYILMSSRYLRLDVDSTATLSATVVNLNGTSSEISWSSSDVSVATVSSEGVVKGISRGHATISATTNNGLTGFCKVDVGVNTPSFEVVEELSLASGDYVDVYNKSDGKWYKKNNLNEYEEYGVMPKVADLSLLTTYVGKLAILTTDNHEYRWDGSQWVDLGEISGTIGIPDGYTELDYIQNKNYSYINTGFKPDQDTRIVMTAQVVSSTKTGHFAGSGPFNQLNTLQFAYEIGTTGTMHISWGMVAGWTDYPSCVGDFNVHTYDLNKNSFYRDGELVGSTTYTNFQCANNLGIFVHLEGNEIPLTNTAGFLLGKLFSFKLYDDGILVRDLVPCKRNEDNKVGVYDLVNNTFYYSQNNYQFNAGDEVQHIIPLEYDIKTEPVNWVSFNTFAELEAMENPWVGMHATVDGVAYIYTKNGWEESQPQGWKYYLWHFNGIAARSDNCYQNSEFDLVDSQTGEDVYLLLVSSNIEGFPNEVAANLFDNSTSTKLCAQITSTVIANNYVVFAAEDPIIPSTFSMTTADDSGERYRWATSWDLYASNTFSTDWTDGTWTKILSGTAGSEQRVSITRFDYPITYNP